MNRNDPNRDGRDRLRESLRGLVPPNSREHVWDIKHPSNDQRLPDDRHPQEEDKENPASREWCELRAIDLHSFSSIVVKNARSPNQIKEAVSAAGRSCRGFNKDLADLIQTLATSLDRQPLVDMYDRFKEIGLESVIPLETKAPAERQDAVLKRYREFFDLVDPGTLRDLFQVPEEVRALLTKAAAISIEALSNSESFKADLKALTESQPPQTAIRLDEESQAVVSKLFSTLCALWDQTLQHGMKRSFGPENLAQCPDTVGLIGIIPPNLLALTVTHVLGKLVSDFHLHDHLPRLDKVCAAVRSPTTFANSKGFRQKDMESGGDFIQQVLRLLPALQAALAFRQEESALVEVSCFAATIPDDQILPLGQRQEMFKYENRLMVKLSPHTWPYTFLCAVGPHNVDLELFIVPADDAKNRGSSTISVTQNGAITFPASINFIPVTDEDFRRIFPDALDLNSMSETVRRVAGHALFILKGMQEAAPTLLCRVQELPKYMGLEWLDDQLVLIVPRVHLGEFLKLFEYDSSIYQKLVYDTQYNPAEKIVDLSDQLSFAFNVKLASGSEAESGQELTIEKHSVVMMPAQEVQSRRVVSALLRDKLSSYEDLRSILEKHFGVEETTQGKGGHKMAVRQGYRFTLASNYRDPSAPLHIPITNKLLDSLCIPRDELRIILEQM